MDFTGQIHRLCAPHDKAGLLSAGRPPIDPAVLFKMMMVGFLEGISSDRGIAARCADSLILRRFLGYALTEETPDHSSFTVFRKRLPQEVFQAAHEVVLEGLRTHGLLKGRHLGIDSSVMVANASLSGLARRNDEKSYWNYVRELAREAGVDAEDPATVARFDRRRKDRKTSNKEWVNPAEPDAKAGRTKEGACDMIYKPEHIVDLESGAIIAAAVRPGEAGDTGDTGDLSGRVLDAVELVEEIHGRGHQEGASHVKDLIGDKGFHHPRGAGHHPASHGDPHHHRRPQRRTPPAREP